MTYTFTSGEFLVSSVLANARAHAFVGELPLTKQVELMRGLSTIHFSSGEVIFRQGDLSDALYFILGPTTDPEPDGQDDEYVLLTTETNKEGDEAGGDGGDESKRELPFIPSQGFFGEEGLVYRCVHRASIARGHPQPHTRRTA